MKKIIGILNRFWFFEAPPERLGILRVLIGAYALYYIGTRYEMLMEIAVTSRDLYDPVGLASLLGEPIFPFLFKIIVILTLILNILFIFGWKFRFVGPLYSILLLFVLSYRNSWSMVYHSHNVLVLHALILGFTRAGDAFSIDYLFRSGFLTFNNKKKKVVDKIKPYPSWKYGWPIMLMCVVSLCAYFLAGYAKVESASGWGWMSGEVLRSQVAVDGLRKAVLGSGAPALVYVLYDQVFLFTLLGVGTFILELGAPIAILNRRIGKIWAISAFFMHWGIYFIMDIKFRYQMSGILFATFFDVEKTFQWIRYSRNKFVEPVEAKDKSLVFFDGVCNFCSGAVKFILERDSRKTFKFASLQSDAAEEKLEELGLKYNKLSSIVLIEDQIIYTKSCAVLRILRNLSGLWPLLYVFIVVPKPVRDYFYNKFAENRYSLFGKKSSCFVPTEDIRGRFLDLS